MLQILIVREYEGGGVPSKSLFPPLLGYDNKCNGLGCLCTWFQEMGVESHMLA